MKADVSFVILSHNDAEMVINAIKSIKKLKTKYSFDIFVVDNGSKDDTPKLIKKKFKNIRVIELPKNIGTAAYDKAIKKSKSKYIYYTGCDVEVKNDMLDKLVDFIEHNELVIQTAPKYIDFNNRGKIDLGGTWLSRSFYSDKFKDNTLGNQNLEIPYIGTGLIRADFIKKFGYLFDNDYFFYGEDVDLGLRIRLLGYKTYYIPRSIVYHVGSVSRNIHNTNYLTFLMEKNLLTTFFKILSIKNIFLFLPYVFFMRLFAILRDVVKFNFDDTLARLKAIFWILFNFNFIMKKRRDIQKIRKVDDNYILKIFREKPLFKLKFIV
jgi:GT2 family glycosyltransferase|tara:strand:+ start:3692 stop:4660 length:969 start_codon:yes stop_codon:yes gene_type:complete